MSEKSHVGMGHSVCPVCGKEHDEVVLFDRRLRDTLTSKEFMGFELCSEHKALFDQGFVALIAVEGEPPKGKLIDQYNWAVTRRTGELVHIKREAFRRVFRVAIPDDLPMTWVEPAVVDHLRELMAEANRAH